MMELRNFVFDDKTPVEKYQELFTLPAGTLFVVSPDSYETFMERIEELKPSDGDFEVFPVTPGTDVYSLTGPDHAIIVRNTLINNG